MIRCDPDLKFGVACMAPARFLAPHSSPPPPPPCPFYEKIGALLASSNSWREVRNLPVSLHIHYIPAFTISGGIADKKDVIFSVNKVLDSPSFYNRSGTQTCMALCFVYRPQQKKYFSFARSCQTTRYRMTAVYSQRVSFRVT